MTSAPAPAMPSPPRVTAAEIRAAVAREFLISINDLVARTRGRAVARPRQYAMWLAHICTPMSYPEIGREFGDRHHATVMNAVRVVEGLRRDGAGLRKLLDRMVNDLGGDTGARAADMERRRMVELGAQIVERTAELTRAVSALATTTAELILVIRKGNAADGAH